MTPENAQKCALGIKTQTRRVVKWPQWAKPEECAVLLQRSPTGIAYYEDGYPRRRMTCPYGATGDLLWVREGFSYWEDNYQWIPKKGLRWEDLSPDKRADVMERLSHAGEDYLVYKCGVKRSLSEWAPSHEIYEHCIGKFGKTIPAIHMPRWACRTVLEITEVRVERLQAITQLDALHEGCKGPDHKATFFHLWESINGAGSWDQNPWVWVLVFHKVSAA